MRQYASNSGRDYGHGMEVYSWSENLGLISCPHCPTMLDTGSTTLPSETLPSSTAPFRLKMHLYDTDRERRGLQVLLCVLCLGKLLRSDVDRGEVLSEHAVGLAGRDLDKGSLALWGANSPRSTKRGGGGLPRFARIKGPRCLQTKVILQQMGLHHALESTHSKQT